jgi:hypothetical protein
MHNRISLKQLIATTSLFCLAIGANVAPAAAAPKPAPACVDAILDSPGLMHQKLHLANGCNVAVRVRVLLQFALDTECVALPAHSSTVYSVGVHGKITGIVNC